MISSVLIRFFLVSILQFSAMAYLFSELAMTLNSSNIILSPQWHFSQFQVTGTYPASFQTPCADLRNANICLSPSQNLYRFITMINTSRHHVQISFWLVATLAYFSSHSRLLCCKWPPWPTPSFSSIKFWSRIATSRDPEH